MRKTLLKVGLASAAVLLMSNSADAQTTVNQNLNVTLTIASRAQLTLSTNTLVIPDGDPATVLSLDAPALTVNVGARTASTQPINLTVLAAGNLTGTGGTIAIGDLTWTAGGTGFVGGTSNATAAQSLGTWNGSGLRTGTQNYSLPNSWAYGPGNYATSVTYTLVVP